MLKTIAFLIILLARHLNPCCAG